MNCNLGLHLGHGGLLMLDLTGVSLLGKAIDPNHQREISSDAKYVKKDYVLKQGDLAMYFLASM